MSSSQGANTATVSGYSFNMLSIRDGSDWTSYKKQARMATNYKSSSTDNKTPLAWWERYGNNFRLDYLAGLRKCNPCPVPPNPAGSSKSVYNMGPVGSV